MRHPEGGERGWDVWMDIPWMREAEVWGGSTAGGNESDPRQSPVKPSPQVLRVTPVCPEPSLRASEACPGRFRSAERGPSPIPGSPDLPGTGTPKGVLGHGRWRSQGLLGVVVLPADDAGHDRSCSSA